ncbi:MAG: ABC transporter permease [Bacillus sp. (in: firmicutes)]
MNLVANEMMKLFKKPSTYIMITMLVIIIIGVGGINKYMDSRNGSDNEAENWRENLTQQIQVNKEELAVTEEGNWRERLIEEITVAEYRLAHDLPPATEYNNWSFVNDMVGIISFISILTIVVASSIVANEFSTGTIKLLLIRPVSRVKVLFSKYISVLLFSLILIVLSFVVSLIIGAVLFGFSDVGPQLLYNDGQVMEQSQIWYAFVTFLLNSVSLLMLTTMAFMISTVFRNSSLAIGISIFLLLMGGNLSFILAGYFDWAKYILFNNLDLISYYNGTPLIEGMTLSFSLLTLLAYFLIFHIVSFLFFTKRDVRA